LEFNRKSTQIVLFLDDIFKIEEIKINNKAIEFVHENDKILIEYYADNGDSIDAVIKYKGVIHIENDFGVDEFYCSNHAVNITDLFYWYPRLDNDYLINYKVKLIGNSKVYTNLDTISENNEFLKNTYIFNGKSIGVSLFSGDYKEIIDGGIEYIIPYNYDYKKYKSKLDNYITSYLNSEENKLSQDEINKINNKKYSKVIVGVNVSNTEYIKFTNNTLLVEL